jgi:hypothetical protein
MSSARDRLNDIISDGVVIDIYYAEEALALYELIGRHADRINAESYGAFFGSLQMTLLRQLILAVSRIFECERGRYALRSIPAAIKVLREGADELSIEQPRALRSFHPIPDIGAAPAPSPEVTRMVATHFDQTVPKAGLAAPQGPSKTLDTLKTVRDKLIAHPEAVRIEDLPKATFKEIVQLLEFAKGFVCMVGFAYLSSGYSDDSGEYFLSGDAERASRCLKRLLERVGC